jgi:hypothetical protein
MINRNAMNNQKSNEPVVLGQQLADAQKYEQARLQMGNTPPSPLPQGDYEPRAGEWELLNPAPSDLDVQIRKACKTFTILPESERAKFTSAISMDEFYKLIEFARRAAVFALRNKDVQLLQDGLTAVTMIEAKRTDFTASLAPITFSRPVDRPSLLRFDTTNPPFPPSSDFDETSRRNKSAQISFNVRPQPGLLPQEKERQWQISGWRKTSGQSRRTTFQKRGERFSLSAGPTGERAGVRWR